MTEYRIAHHNRRARQEPKRHSLVVSARIPPAFRSAPPVSAAVRRALERIHPPR